jgi:hypothetical protein
MQITSTTSTTAAVVYVMGYIQNFIDSLSGLKAFFTDWMKIKFM